MGADAFGYGFALIRVVENQLAEDLIAIHPDGHRLSVGFRFELIFDALYLLCKIRPADRKQLHVPRVGDTRPA